MKKGNMKKGNVKKKQIVENNDDWYIRDFDEFDEKLPIVAKRIVLEGIDFTFFEREEDPDPEVVAQIFDVLSEEISCVTEMTGEELDVSFGRVITACYLVVMENKGIIQSMDDGTYGLTEQGKLYAEKNLK